MKLLFLANRTPYPPFRGDKLKIYHLAKRLKARGHELHLLCFAQNKEDFAARAKLEEIFSEVHLVGLPTWKSALNCVAALWDKKPIQVLYFQERAMRQKLQELMSRNRFDAVHVQHLRMAPYLANTKSLPRILDLPDAFSLYWKRRKELKSGLLKSWFERLEARRVLAYEPVMDQFDRALVCSKEDLSYLEATHGVQNLRLLPNGVDLETFYPRDHDYSSGNTLLFTGNMDYAPNVDAVHYFVADVLPLIREKCPQVRFVIAGQRPVESVKSLASSTVEVTGFVQDLAEMYNAATVVVAPMRIGAGTQNKVLEAMAMGIPVVCTNIGFEGLEIAQGEGAFMQLDAATFAAQVIELLQQADLREMTGRKGVAVMQARFGWDAVSAQLEQYFMELL
ncbi:MAG: glycosyltransferase [Bacteroidetes bacterium]|nr:glycosyltransferase [Bacteroidota bacterium]